MTPPFLFLSTARVPNVKEPPEPPAVKKTAAVPRDPEITPALSAENHVAAETHGAHRKGALKITGLQFDTHGTAALGKDPSRAQARCSFEWTGRMLSATSRSIRAYLQAKLPKSLSL
jgi:hypothetical protein